MLRLMIADDERAIRESISRLIDWKTYDIELVGLCKNGLEAYDMILDESPDIVLTDIKMPGLDGLELIRKISETGLSVQFIILSGYGEFEYAKKAMKYGVKHYLLKPCNEQQIIDSIKDVSRDCYQNLIIRYNRKDQFETADRMRHYVLFGILNDAVYQKKPFHEALRTYEPYMDFHFTDYRLFYVYFLEQECLEEFLTCLKDYRSAHFPEITVHGIYTANTLLLFFKDFSSNYQDFTTFLTRVKLTGQHVQTEVEQAAYKNLFDLLEVVLEKVRRYSMIYYISNLHVLSCCNYNFLISESEQLYQAAMNREAGALDALTELLAGIHDLRFLKQLASSLFLKITAGDTSLSTVSLTEVLLVINEENDLGELKLKISDYLRELFTSRQARPAVSPMVQQIFDYVNAHIKEPSLTLKYISEQYLYMNTDYVSKRFQKETGIRFSAYLTGVRIEKAKEYLAGGGEDKILQVAAAVGCGNNPQYFSQMFKKNTGMTPSAYASMIKGGNGK